jgi:hypothetical protein
MSNELWGLNQRIDKDCQKPQYCDLIKLRGNGDGDNEHISTRANA